MESKIQERANRLYEEVNSNICIGAFDLLLFSAAKMMRDSGIKKIELKDPAFLSHGIQYIFEQDGKVMYHENKTIGKTKFDFDADASSLNHIDIKVLFDIIYKETGY